MSRPETTLDTNLSSRTQLEISYINKALASLNTSFLDLVKVLEPYSLPEAPTAVGNSVGTESPHETVSSHVANLVSVRERIESVSERLNKLKTSLDL